MARSLCGHARYSTSIRVYRETVPCRLDVVSSSFVSGYFPSWCTHTHTLALSPTTLRLCDEEKRKKGGKEKKKGLEKKADRWKRFNYRAHPLTGGGSLFAAGDRKWKSLCKWRASLLRKRYFEDRVGVERNERIEKEKEGGGKGGKGRKRFRGCVAMSCNCMLPMKFRPCVSTSSFSILCFRIYICTRRNNFPRSSSSTSLS